MNEGLVDFYVDFFQNALSRKDIEKVMADTKPSEHFTKLQELVNRKEPLVEETSADPENAEVQGKEPDVQRIICDMHGFNRSSALQYARRILLSLQVDHSYEVEFIVGKGIHNRFGRSLMKEDVADVCMSLGFKWLEPPENQGKIRVSVSRNEDPNEKSVYHYETAAIRRGARSTAKQQYDALKNPIQDTPPAQRSTILQ